MAPFKTSAGAWKRCAFENGYAKRAPIYDRQYGKRYMVVQDGALFRVVRDRAAEKLLKGVSNA